MRRVGDRFSGLTEGTTVLSGLLTRGDTREAIQITRRQSEANETVEIVKAGSSSTWDDLAGFKEDEAVPPAEREIAERVIRDSVDRFVLDQTRGAAYTVVGRFVRAGITNGSENYEGPLWRIVRVNESPATHPTSEWRLYYINEKTGLIDKVLSEQDGRHYEAAFSEWRQENGEWFPREIIWTCDGQTLMTLSLTSTSVSMQ
jgi:hypothetical protein